MKKVIALRKFRDLKENTIRKKGDVFEVSEDRFKQITGIATKYPFIEEYKEPKATEETEEATEEATEEKPKRTRRKTATK